MIGGQQLDLEGGHDLATLHALKTGRALLGLDHVRPLGRRASAGEHPPWRAFAGELGLLFQIVDDILDGDGYVLAVGPDEARRLADEAGDRAQAASPRSTRTRRCWPRSSPASSPARREEAA